MKKRKRIFLISYLLLLISLNTQAQNLYEKEVEILVISSKFNNDFITPYYYLIINDSILHVSSYFKADNTPCFLSKSDSLTAKLILAQTKADVHKLKDKLNKSSYKPFKTTTDKKYSYYWTCIKTHLQFYFINCADNPNPLEAIANNTISFIPLKCTGPIKESAPKTVIMNKITRSLK